MRLKSTGIWSLISVFLLACIANGANDWENEAIFGINKQPARATGFSWADKATALKAYDWSEPMDVPGTQPEQIAYATAEKITGPWTYRGLVTGPAKVGFTIHPSVIEFKGQWYFFYHSGSYKINGEPGGDCRRSVCLERLYFNEDGTIKPIVQTIEGISASEKQ